MTSGNAVARYALGPNYRSWRGARGLRRALVRLEVERNTTQGLRGLTALEVPALRVDDGADLCFIAGCGFDSFILDDYQRLRDTVQKVPGIRQLLSSVFGYFVATAAKTLPQYALGNRRMTVRVTALGAASYVDPRRGDAAIPLRRNGPVELYAGKATIVVSLLF